MSAIYLDIDPNIMGILENQKRGLCLISAFIQGLGDSRLTPDMIKHEIVKAMEFVNKHEYFFTDMSNTSFTTISTWTDNIIEHVNNGFGLHPGQFWNIEILENYIVHANIAVRIYYYIEVENQNKYVLVRTRENMECPTENMKILIIAEKCNHHKVLVNIFPPDNNAYERFRHFDFRIPIEYKASMPNFFASIQKNMFLPVHLARVVPVTHFGACGYKCFSGVLGISLFLFKSYDIQ